MQGGCSVFLLFLLCPSPVAKQYTRNTHWVPVWPWCLRGKWSGKLKIWMCHVDLYWHNRQIWGEGTSYCSVMSVSDGKLNCTSAYTLQCQIILWWHPYTSSYFQESFHRWAGVCRMCLAIPELCTKHMACNNICKMLLRVDRASLSKETAACRQMKITGGSRLLAFGEPQNMARSLAASTNMTQNMLSIILIYSK